MAYRPQNTMAAFELAWQMGAAGIELDVQYSKDGVALIYHDDFLHTLTNGAGKVKEHDCAYLLNLDAGSHFSKQYAGLKIPTLEAVLRARPAHTFVNIELKTELDIPSFFSSTPILIRQPESSMEIHARRLAKITAQCIQDVARDVPDLLNYLLVSSFHPIALEAFAQLMPSVAIGQLHCSTTQYNTAPLMAQLAHHAIHLNVRETTRTQVEKAHQAGLYVNCWTVNDVDDARRLMDWGVDGIITNYPDIMLGLV